MKLAGQDIGPECPLFIIAGPDSLESETLAVEVAGRLAEIARELGMVYVFKGSFDKANRSARGSYRGPGLDAGLKILHAVKAQTGALVLTDVHTAEQAEPVAAVADVLQTPAFLCRQTDYITAVASAGRPVNIKKGQFLAPGEVAGVLDKARAAGNEDIMICERGFAFGYNNLVVDMRGLATMRAFGAPVVFDASHSVQLPGGQGTASGGQREHIPVLARAAVAAGVSGLFFETHPDPARALCDGPNALPLAGAGALLRVLKRLDEAVKVQPYLEQQFSKSALN